MKTALIITVGTTAEPILKAIEEVRQESGALRVFLLYGRPLPEQKPSPFEVANEAKRKGEEAGATVRLFEAANPEDVDVCLAAMRSIFREAIDAERVIVNFTGGTKVLAAAAVHAALAEPLSGSLVLDYTGGPVRDAQGRVVRDAMRTVRSERTATDELLQQVLQRLKRADYRAARLLGEHFPERGRGGFAKKAAEALYLWDEFDYESSVQILRRLYEPARLLSDDEQVSALTTLVIRLLEPGNRLYTLVQALRQERAPAWSEIEHFPLLIADALESASRRLDEERATDSVLRSYRAVELALHMRLLQKGIKPWRPDWHGVPEDTMKRYLALLNGTQPPRQLALYTGWTLLEAMGQTFREDKQQRLKDLQQSRNSCYVEHGYQRIKVEDGRRLNEYAATLCEELVGQSLDAARRSVRHSW